MKKVTKKRVKRFGGEDGSFVEDEFGPNGNSSSGGTDIYAAARKRDEDKANSDAYEAKIQALSQDSNSDDSKGPEQGLSPNFKRPEFVEGRDYTVAPSPVRAAPKKAAAPKAIDTSSDNLAVQARADAALKRRIAQTKAQEAGGMESHPELYLNPGRIGTKAVMEAAQALARGKGAAKGAAERIEPYMEQAAPYLKELPSRAKQLLLGEKPNFIMMKKGGSTKKMSSGGSTSKTSASSRGDGIASRGKTRGKLC